MLLDDQLEISSHGKRICSCSQNSLVFCSSLSRVEVLSYVEISSSILENVLVYFRSYSSDCDGEILWV